GSVNLPLPNLVARLAELPTGRDLVVHCEGGYRSAIACSLLARSGRVGVHDLVGGIKAWQASQLPVEVAPGAAPSCGTTSCASAKN
ncbi:MAG: rhodanese-like domain-containing protein, partial [Planctomycetaceae bacterium]